MTTPNPSCDTLDLTQLLSTLQAFKRGDLSARMPADWTGLAGTIAGTLNDIIHMQSTMVEEITEVSDVVGREGHFERRARVPQACGGWATMVRSLNGLIDDLVRPTIEMDRVLGAVAQGDLAQTMTLDVNGRLLKGQFQHAATTANTMVDQLGAIASEVTRVAREVGTEGKLGGQALVPGAFGTWKDLTEDVNQLAANLTTQIRAIAEVAIAVTRGDLSRSIRVEARGEVADLADNINEMIRHLKQTTQQNAQQDWLKTNLARFTQLLQGQRDLSALTSLILSELAPLVSAHHGMFYIMDGSAMDGELSLVGSYGYRFSGKLPTACRPGDGLVGQCALEKTRIWHTNVPRDDIQVSSSLGAAPPTNIVVLPILFEQQVKAVIEIASLGRFTETHLSFLDQLMEPIGVVLNTIEANSRTESLLTQSQSLAQELQQTNLALAEKARLLSEQNIEIERKNREVEQAKLALEEKAKQLALSSKYKSEFLANMSHELRTPLNSLLILAQQLADNPEGNLSERQIEFAKTIHGSGSDLLTLINDILDLSKIESGTVTLQMSEYRFQTLRQYVERTFGHMADARRIAFNVELAERLPTAIMTDTTRLQQVLKNLLANAFKFTRQGEVTLRIGLADVGWTSDHPRLSAAQNVVAFSVADTGIGIPADKLQLIFEAFQQADGSTARQYGGTGLGLSISRELARLLGGEISVGSEVGVGSVFTLYLPCETSGASEVAPLTELGALPPPRGSAKHAAVKGEWGTPGGGNCGGCSESDITCLPLYCPLLSLPDAQRQSLDDMRKPPVQLVGRKVLVVDDDMRNIFALSAALVREGMTVCYAENGRDGIDVLRSNPDVEIVLMDITMPEMDGYATTRAIRCSSEFEALPIITLTAKAMKGDGDKCIAAGASDYITKPVDICKLLSMMRVWLHR